MAFAVLNELVAKKEVQLDYATAEKNYIKAICKGLFKIMSKWVSAPSAPTGAQRYSRLSG